MPEAAKQAAMTGIPAGRIGAAEEVANAVAFLKQAFAQATDPATKSMLAVEISGTELSMKNAAEAANYASQARQLNPENGYAYIMLAQSYAAGATACQGFDSQTVFWLAYDVLASGRKLFAEGSPEQKQIDETMAMFRRSFPSRDELFFRGLTSAGAPYDVKCGWITGRTTVKMVD